MKREKILFFSVLAAAVALYFCTDADFPAFLILFLLLYLPAAFLTGRYTGKKLKYRFYGPSQGAKKENAGFTLQIKNSSLLPVIRCRLWISAENVLTGEKTVQEQSAALAPRGVCRLSFGVTDRYCGQIRVKLERVLVQDPLGICSREEKADAGVEYYVMPAVGEIPPDPESVSHYDMESYRYSAERKGSDPSETFGLRSYLPGDSMKAIHWKLSGKLDDLIVREPGLPIDNSLMMILDKRLPADGSVSAELIDRTTELFAALSHGAARQEISHTAGWYNAAGGRFAAFQIESGDDMFRMLPELLASPCGEDALSAADHFTEADMDKNFACFIYVAFPGTDAEKETERLSQYGKVIIYTAENSR